MKISKGRYRRVRNPLKPSCCTVTLSFTSMLMPGTQLFNIDTDTWQFIIEHASFPQNGQAGNLTCIYV